MIGGRRYWRVPVMDGEFLCEDDDRHGEGGRRRQFPGRSPTSQPQALAACEAAIDAMRKVPDVIMPFPGGVVRSGSKVGSKYKALIGLHQRRLLPDPARRDRDRSSAGGIGSVLEIVIDGLTDADVARRDARRHRGGLRARRRGGIRRITAGNYGGKLGQFHFKLREIMA